MIVRHHQSLVEQSEAHYSDCEQYRYLLRRRWGEGPRWLFVMLNPSTATELANDPTVARCQTRAMRAGAGAMSVCNLFALRSTDPKALRRVADPVGSANDPTIAAEVLLADQVICAWGADPAIGERGRQVLDLVRRSGRQPQALQLNRDGSPKHPLYVAYAAEPSPIPD